MTKRGGNPNTRCGGQHAETRIRQIVANPDGSREERRAAAKLAKKRPAVCQHGLLRIGCDDCADGAA